ncbi:hypothetical protein PG994_014572 [Apiospora phragmitis]|uniref:Uncharacterized protein n=1 Tax=Apiospora phragmitis TaxID=2905665 RepID=A0ABR1T4N3_9PEZI
MEFAAGSHSSFLAKAVQLPVTDAARLRCAMVMSVGCREQLVFGHTRILVIASPTLAHCGTL